MAAAELIVPFLADREDTDAFETIHTVLGQVVGETFGYLLTATWTVLIIYALGQHLAGRWFTYVGLIAAALIALGVLAPLDVPGTDFANFVGTSSGRFRSPSPFSSGVGRPSEARQQLHQRRSRADSRTAFRGAAPGYYGHLASDSEVRDPGSA